MFELVWGPPGGSEAPSVSREPVTSAEELEQLLARLDAAGREGEPFIAMLVHPEHGQLGIGLGSDTSIATFEGADGEPPYLISSGNGAPGEDDPAFFFEGEWSEFPATAAIPLTDALQAMAEFLASGERPSNLRWVET
jgi:Immunity protein Imm1